MPNVVLLDAGDEFQGTLYSTVYKEVMPPGPIIAVSEFGLIVVDIPLIVSPVP